MNKLKLTILMPCLNEAETIAKCINKAKKWIAKNNYPSEILIADNGSTDDSKSIARSLGARVIKVKSRGYGNALYYGILDAKGKYIIMGDADDSYDFSKLDFFIKKLEDGYDLVMGNRFAGGIMQGAMPWKNKYIGNPVLSCLGRLLFKSKIKDFHCGLRGINKAAFVKMDLRTSGMEFASEMVIKASIFELKIAEVPTILSKDGRSRPPHLKPWRDGWRHLRFMLLFSPQWLFIKPGLFLFVPSLIFYTILLSRPISIQSITFDVHSLFYLEALVVIGVLSIIFGCMIKLIAAREGLMKKIDVVNLSNILEIGALLSSFLVLIGIYFGYDAFDQWRLINFRDIHHNGLLRIVSFSSLLIMLGGILFLSSLVMGFLILPTRRLALKK